MLMKHGENMNNTVLFDKQHNSKDKSQSLWDIQRTCPNSSACLNRRHQILTGIKIQLLKSAHSFPGLRNEIDKSPWLSRVFRLHKSSPILLRFLITHPTVRTRE